MPSCPHRGLSTEHAQGQSQASLHLQHIEHFFPDYCLAPSSRTDTWALRVPTKPHQPAPTSCTHPADRLFAPRGAPHCWASFKHCKKTQQVVVHPKKHSCPPWGVQRGEGCSWPPGFVSLPEDKHAAFRKGTWGAGSSTAWACRAELKACWERKQIRGTNNI